MSFSEKLYNFTAMPPDTQVTGPTTGLNWTNEPKIQSIVAGKGLKVIPKPGTDHWRKTYVSPPSQADRASSHGLLYKMPANVSKWSAVTKFSMTIIDLYDQAGLMVLVDNQHWLKTGIEYEGGKPCMSCVVTNGESDWNFVPWPTSTDIEIRVQLERFGNMADCTVEYKDGEDWIILRQAPLVLGSSQAEVNVGLFCSAPKNEEGKPAMEVLFQSLKIAQSD